MVYLPTFTMIKSLKYRQIIVNIPYTLILWVRLFRSWEIQKSSKVLTGFSERCQCFRLCVFTFPPDVPFECLPKSRKC